MTLNLNEALSCCLFKHFES